MPTYEYRCKDCNHTFDAVQSFTDDALTDCPACAGALRKVFGNVGITFKGSGFYRTDSRSGSSADTKSTNGDGGGRSEDRTSSDRDRKSPSPKESKEGPDTKSASKQEPSGGSGSKADSGSKSGSDTSPSSTPA